MTDENKQVKVGSLIRFSKECMERNADKLNQGYYLVIDVKNPESRYNKYVLDRSPWKEINLNFVHSPLSDIEVIN